MESRNKDGDKNKRQYSPKKKDKGPRKRRCTFWPEESDSDSDRDLSSDSDSVKDSSVKDSLFKIFYQVVSRRKQ